MNMVITWTVIPPNEGADENDYDCGLGGWGSLAPDARGSTILFAV